MSAFFQMHFITPTSLKSNKKERYASPTSQQVEHLTRSCEQTPTSSRIFLSKICPSPIIKRINFRKTKGIRADRTLLRNGVIIKVHHGMICQNAKLERHFWKNCQHLTCPTEPWSNLIQMHQPSFLRI